MPPTAAQHKQQPPTAAEGLLSVGRRGSHPIGTPGLLLQSSETVASPWLVLLVLATVFCLNPLHGFDQLQRHALLALEQVVLEALFSLAGEEDLASPARPFGRLVFLSEAGGVGLDGAGAEFVARVGHRVGGPQQGTCRPGIHHQVHSTARQI